MKAHFQNMAGYNRWANGQLYDAVAKLPPPAFVTARSGFFPSLMRTLNHILVGDAIWMGRLDGTGHRHIASLDQVLHEEFRALRQAREAMDDRIVASMDGLSSDRLAQDLTYHTMAGLAMVTPIDQVLTHFFNHQTHHRGQAHAMLSSTDVPPPSLDLILYARDNPRRTYLQ